MVKRALRFEVSFHPKLISRDWITDSRLLNSNQLNLIWFSGICVIGRRGGILSFFRLWQSKDTFGAERERGCSHAVWRRLGRRGNNHGHGYSE